MLLPFASRLITKSVLGVIRATDAPNSVLIFKINNAVRCLSNQHVTSSISKDSIQSSKNQTWTPIYFFPQINLARFLNRFKLYQSIFTVVSLPMTLGFYYYDMSDFKTVLIVTGAATFTCLSLYVITAFFKRLIGVVYIDKKKKNVRIAHLTFWGNRSDITVPVEDIIPLTHGNCNVSDAFVQVFRNNSEEVLYMTLLFGKILDEENFQNVFGSFEILGLKK